MLCSISYFYIYSHRSDSSACRVPPGTARRGSNDPLPRTLTRGTTSMTTGFGGFPNPVKVVANAAQKRLLPKVATLDMPRTTTLQSVYSDRGNSQADGGLSNISGGPTRAVSYISFDAVVGRNSRFYSLTSTQRDELGGVEYRVSRATAHCVRESLMLTVRYCYRRCRLSSRSSSHTSCLYNLYP